MKLDDFTPTGVRAPTRLGNGTTQDGRLMTTEEQRAEAIEWALGEMRHQKVMAAEVLVHWTTIGMEPTILAIEAEVEHVSHEGNREKLFVLKSVTDRTATGAEFTESSEARVARLMSEVETMAKEKQL